MFIESDKQIPVGHRNEKAAETCQLHLMKMRSPNVDGNIFMTKGKGRPQPGDWPYRGVAFEVQHFAWDYYKPWRKQTFYTAVRLEKYLPRVFCNQA